MHSRSLVTFLLLVQPVADEDLPVPQLAAAWPRRHACPVEGEVLGGAQECSQLDDALAGDRRLEVIGVVGRPEPGPGDEVGARRDRADRVKLEHRQPPDRGEQVRWSLAGQHLGADGDPPRVLPAELVHRGHGDEGNAWPRQQRRVTGAVPRPAG
jgi:hypothetical protein